MVPRLTETRNPIHGYKHYNMELEKVHKGNHRGLIRTLPPLPTSERLPIRLSRDNL